MTLEMLCTTLLVRRAPARHAAGTTKAASASRAPTPLGLRSQAILNQLAAPVAPNSSTPRHGQQQRPQRVAAVSNQSFGGDDAIAGPSAPQ